MRLLLDESLPEPLAASFEGHVVATVQKAGWAGLGNGELLQTIADAGYDALITADKGFEYQQNQDTLPITVVVSRAKSNRLEDLEPLVPLILQQLRKAAPRTLIKIGDL